MKAITDHDLNAYVDGQLDPARCPEVEAFLGAHPQAVEKVGAYRKQNEMLHALFDPAMDEAVPTALCTTGRHAGRSRPQWLRYAAMIGTLAIGATLGYLGRGLVSPTVSPLALYKQAAFAHVAFVPEILHPVEVGAQQETHLVNWLSKRLGGPVRAPHLDAAGFELMGGRLLPDAARPAAQFMYQDSRGQRLTLYLKREPKNDPATAFRFAQQNGVSVFYWVDRDFGYALSGELPKAELLRVAEAVYKQLNP